MLGDCLWLAAFTGKGAPLELRSLYCRLEFFILFSLFLVKNKCLVWFFLIKKKKAKEITEKQTLFV